MASEKGHQDVVQKLLGAGADMNILRMPNVSVIMLLLIVFMQNVKRTFVFRVEVLCG